MTTDTGNSAQSQAVQDGLGERLRRFLGTRLGLCVFAFLGAGVLYLIERLWLPDSPDVRLVTGLGYLVFFSRRLQFLGCRFLSVPRG